MVTSKSLNLWYNICEATCGDEILIKSLINETTEIRQANLPSNTFKLIDCVKAKPKRLMTHKEIFKAISDGAVIRYEDNNFFKNTWFTDSDVINYFISYDGGETEQDMYVEDV